nr:response regulator [Desulfobacula sp.]
MKDLEEKLDRAKKMELIGTMAGGVAHDLNNILSGLVSYPELLLMQLPQDSPLKEPVSFMHDAGLRAAEIVQDLLTLTRRGINVENSINLNQVIQDYFVSATHKRLEKNYPQVRFKVYPEADLLNILGSASHISKIIMNLVINAAEAIKGKGTVTVESFNRYLDLPLKGYDDILEGEYVVLRVTDSGAGIPRKDLNKIFEPFYTKKHMGRSGSGLGLCVVWNCVKDHAGYIEVTSKINKGSTFEIFFPATRKEAGPEPEPMRIEDFKGNKETVLVIDDVHEQRRIARDSLKMLGYRPFTVPSGEKALLFLKNRAVDLIILDMKMEPGMDGLDTYKRILRLYPDQKAVIASGFSENDRVRETLKIGAGQYIKKPYTIKKLALAIKEELANHKNRKNH